MLRVQRWVKTIASQAWVGNRQFVRRWQSGGRSRQSSPFGLRHREGAAHAKAKSKFDISDVRLADKESLQQPDTKGGLSFHERGGTRFHPGNVPKPGKERFHDTEAKVEFQSREDFQPISGSTAHGSGKASLRQPSLIEQLFPEESKGYGVQQEKTREIPRLPLEITPSRAPVAHKKVDEPFTEKSTAAKQLEHQQRQDGSRTGVLVLRNASTNLVEEDFRRLVPQGKHLEGWTLEQGDIVKVIPGRDLATLAQNGTYYLLFSSALSAFTYQGHVTRIHLATAQYSPSSLSSPIPPPPGHVIDGIDAGAAMSAYSLVPPTQDLELRQLKSPISPIVASMINNRGYRSLMNRSDRWPFEVRLTLEGPQFSPGRVRYTLQKVGHGRSLGWSGDPNGSAELSVVQWEPPQKSSPAMYLKEEAWTPLLERTEEDQVQRDLWRQESSVYASVNAGEDGESESREQRRRRANAVYIVGFHTERAAQTFVRFWHRRPMTLDGQEGKLEDDEMANADVAPIVNAQILW